MRKVGTHTKSFSSPTDHSCHAVCLAGLYFWVRDVWDAPALCSRRYISSWDLCIGLSMQNATAGACQAPNITWKYAWKQQLALPSTPVVACRLLFPPIRLSPPVLSFIRTCSRQCTLFTQFFCFEAIVRPLNRWYH